MNSYLIGKDNKLKRYFFFLKVYTKFILRGWPQRQQETLYPYTRGLLHG